MQITWECLFHCHTKRNSCWTFAHSITFPLMHLWNLFLMQCLFPSIFEHSKLKECLNGNFHPYFQCSAANKAFVFQCMIVYSCNITTFIQKLKCLQFKNYGIKCAFVLEVGFGRYREDYPGPIARYGSESGALWWFHFHSKE